MRITNKRHDCIAINISDPRENNLPDIGIVELEDSETGKIEVIDTSDTEFRKKLKVKIIEKEQWKKKFFGSINLDYVKISTDKEYVKPLITFFRNRAKRFR